MLNGPQRPDRDVPRRGWPADRQLRRSTWSIEPRDADRHAGARAFALPDRPRPRSSAAMPGGREAHELTTELCVAYSGFAVFGANAAFQFEPVSRTPAVRAGSSQRHGYFSERTWAFALAAVRWRCTASRMRRRRSAETQRRGLDPTRLQRYLKRNDAWPLGARLMPDRRDAMIEALDHIAIAVQRPRPRAPAPSGRCSAGGRTGARRRPGARHAWFQLDNMALDLVQPDGPGESGDRVRAQIEAHGEGLWGLAFAVSDLDETRRMLARRGAPDRRAGGPALHRRLAARLRRSRRPRHGVSIALAERTGRSAAKRRRRRRACRRSTTW